MKNTSVSNFIEKNDFTLKFFDALDHNYAGAENSASIATYITLRSEEVSREYEQNQLADDPIGTCFEKIRECADKICALLPKNDKDEDESDEPRIQYALPAVDEKDGESVLAALKTSAASAHANVSEYHGEISQSVIRSAIDRFTLGLNEHEKDEFSQRAGDILTEYGAQYGENGAQRTLLHQIMDMDISEKELHKYAKRASAFISKHGELSEDELLAAFYITCKKTYGQLSDAQIHAIGYCVGLTQEVASQVREQDPMKKYDAFFADPDNSTYGFLGGYMLVVASLFVVKFVMKVTGAMMWPAFIAMAIASLALYIFLLDEMESGRIRSFIESHKIHKETYNISRRVISYSSWYEEPKEPKIAEAQAEAKPTHYAHQASEPVYA